MPQVYWTSFFFVAYCYICGFALIAFAVGFAAVGATQRDWVRTAVGLYFTIVFTWLFQSIVLNILIRRMRSNMIIRPHDTDQIIDRNI